jgi:hypothetical protein
MANFERQFPLGVGFKTEFPSAKATVLDTNLAKAINGDDGSKHTCASPVWLLDQGLRLDGALRGRIEVPDGVQIVGPNPVTFSKGNVYVGDGTALGACSLVIDEHAAVVINVGAQGLVSGDLSIEGTAELEETGVWTAKNGSHTAFAAGAVVDFSNAETYVNANARVFVRGTSGFTGGIVWENYSILTMLAGSAATFAGTTTFAGAVTFDTTSAVTFKKKSGPFAAAYITLEGGGAGSTDDAYISIGNGRFIAGWTTGVMTGQFTLDAYVTRTGSEVKSGNDAWTAVRAQGLGAALSHADQVFDARTRDVWTVPIEGAVTYTAKAAGEGIAHGTTTTVRRRNGTDPDPTFIASERGAGGAVVPLLTLMTPGSWVDLMYDTTVGSGGWWTFVRFGGDVVLA